jgi:long-chain acyl-CoA synthetase
MRFQDLLYQGAHRTPEKIALHWVDRGRALTYAGAVQAMEQAAGALAALGVQPGDRVGIFAHNGLDYLVAMFGAWRLGAIAALVNVQLAGSLDYYVNDSKPKVLIYTGDHLETIDRHRKKMTSVEHYLCMDGEQPGALDWGAIVRGSHQPPPDPTRETDAAHISYTSGTTGNPKGAVLAHEPTSRATHCIAERLRLGSADATLGPTALSSSYQLVANLLPGLHRGCTVNVMTHWHADQAWEVMDALEISMLAANPTLLRELLDASTRRGRPPARLRIGLSGGGPVPPDLKRKWRDELQIPLVESYGQSELGGFVGLGYPELVADERLGAIGLPLPDKEVRIVDGEDRELPVGEIGEIVLRGGFMLGYWEKPEKTAETLRGGWLHTGDLGSMDAEGYISFLGRKQEQIYFHGTLVFPRRLEEALYRHPAVRFACVIGVPDKSAGAIPTGIVVLEEGQMASPAGLLAHCRQELGGETGVEMVLVIPEMPMTPTGKISRSALEARFGKGAGD